jgi:hypothetical protein
MTLDYKETEAAFQPLPHVPVKEEEGEGKDASGLPVPDTACMPRGLVPVPRGLYAQYVEPLP